MPATYLSAEEFAQLMKLHVVTVRNYCRSRDWRLKRIAQKVGKEWRIDMERFQQNWRGELKK